ncbi:kinase-like domain-containing protein [Vararia minispora EC-137]|uniref:Kinase-like domain-containing protein n=1 Tax=Vararia minispora EC-137 TaxID=1314806 RepID=A0ACB8QA07_9AGAM|nr:kinase-like domain-containing protein [Vararia minispora EC-137]
MEYIAASTTIPVPRVRELFQDSRGFVNIVMDYVDGKELEAIWDGLQSADRLAILHQLRDYIDQLRRLPPPRPGAVEAVDGSECRDPRLGSAPFGPFRTIANFQTFLGRDCALLRSTSQSHRTVFTHGDLAPRNVLVKGTRIVAIVDWETSGWYPEYWEYTQAFFSNFVYPDAHNGSVWDYLEREAFSEKYPDELVSEKCLASYLVRC